MQNRIKGIISKYFILDKHFFSDTLVILVPVVLQNCINQGVNTMDTIMVGKLGETAISASSLANQYYNIYLFLCTGISAAGLVLASQFWGNGDRENVRKTFDLVLQIVNITSMGFFLITILFPEKIMSIYSRETEVIFEGAKYLKIAAFTVLPHGISFSMANMMRTTGNSKLGLITSSISFLFNIVFNYIFIFGKLGFPKMGVQGAALGTFFARIIEFVICIIYIFRYNIKFEYRPNIFVQVHKEIRKEYKRLGTPVIISETLLALSSNIIAAIMGNLGKAVASAYAIVLVVDRLCLVATGAVANASSIVVGHTVGQGNLIRAQKEGNTFLLLSVLIGLFGAFIIGLFGSWSIALYDISIVTAEIASAMMRACIIVFFFQTIQATLSRGVLRGGGDTVFLMKIGTSLQWLVSIPLGWLGAFVFNLSPTTVFLLLRIDFAIKAIWLTFRLINGNWIHRIKNIEL